MSKIKEMSANMKYDLEFFERFECSSDEASEFRKLDNEKKPLPENIYYDSKAVRYFKYQQKSGITNEEFQEYLFMLQTKYLKTIKNCFVFFTVLFIISALIIVIQLLT